MVGPEPLSPEDATLVCATTPEAQLLIGAVCRLDGGPLRDADGELRVDDLRQHVLARLALIPRFRQRVQRVPFDLARPVWVDDADFDIDRHLHVTALPAPGGSAELRAFMGELLSDGLDPGHPMWDLWLIDGLEGDEMAVVLRVHHVIADGLSLVRAAIALLDLEPGDAPPEPPSVPWRPAPTPSSASVAVGAVSDRASHQLGLVVGAARTLMDPRRSLTLARSAARAVTPPPRPIPPLGLTGRVGPRRDLCWSSLPMEPLHTVAHSRGVTVNDMVLAAVTVALRRSLGAEVASSMAQSQPRVLVPVGDAVDDQHGGNRFTFVVAGLPVHLESSELILDHVHREMKERTASDQAANMLALFSVVDVVPVPLLRGLAPGILARQPFVNLTVTNVTGSEAPLYLLGARLRTMHPFVTGVGNVACVIAVLSYRDELAIGITVDPDVVPDADRLLADVVDAAQELGRLGPP